MRRGHAFGRVAHGDAVRHVDDVCARALAVARELAREVVHRRVSIEKGQVRARERAPRRSRGRYRWRRQ
jgi:hypothetical protein